MRKRMYDWAIIDFDEAIRLHPPSSSGYSWALYERGNAWLHKGNYDRAIADLDEAIRLDPRYADAYQTRGAAWLAKGDNLRATADYNAAKLVAVGGEAPVPAAPSSSQSVAGTRPAATTPTDSFEEFIRKSKGDAALAAAIARDDEQAREGQSFSHRLLRTALAGAIAAGLLGLAFGLYRLLKTWRCVAARRGYWFSYRARTAVAATALWTLALCLVRFGFNPIWLVNLLYDSESGSSGLRFLLLLLAPPAICVVGLFLWDWVKQAKPVAVAQTVPDAVLPRAETDPPEAVAAQATSSPSPLIAPRAVQPLSWPGWRFWTVAVFMGSVIVFCMNLIGGNQVPGNVMGGLALFFGLLFSPMWKKRGLSGWAGFGYGVLVGVAAIFIASAMAGAWYGR